jgi:hypothetical protein
MDKRGSFGSSQSGKSFAGAIISAIISTKMTMMGTFEFLSIFSIQLCGHSMNSGDL